MNKTILSLVAGLSVLVGWSMSAPGGEVEMSPISGPVDDPRRHLRLRNPAELPRVEAERIYQLFRTAMANGYAASGYDRIDGYQTWQRHNSEPYLSKVHGNHYLNNYSNEVGSSYGQFEEAGELPVGTVLVKDSFTVTIGREILLGPAFIMEKMPEGFKTVTGNWKYTQVQPDGTVLGETNGEGSDRVDYCIACHLAREDYDHLYFVPPDFRRN